MPFQGLPVEVPFDALDLSTCEEFTEWYRGLLAAGPSRRGDVILDLVGVQLVTAAGVRALCDLEAELAASGRRLAVTGAAPIVLRVFRICDVSERWTP
jgi:anti-anti-sigma factor